MKVINSPVMITTYRRRNKVCTPGGTIKSFLENDENFLEPDGEGKSPIELEFENDRFETMANSRKNGMR